MMQKVVAYKEPCTRTEAAITSGLGRQKRSAEVQLQHSLQQAGMGKTRLIQKISRYNRYMLLWIELMLSIFLLIQDGGTILCLINHRTTNHGNSNHHLC